MRILPLLTAIATMAAITCPVLAQDVGPAKEQPVWINIMLALLLTTIVLLVSIKNSKRSHQD